MKKLIGCLLLLMIMVGCVPTSSELADCEFLPPASADSPRRDGRTPDLIDEAYNEGKITEGEKILYWSYAMYESDSLPSDFLGNKGWHGTYYAEQIDEAMKDSTIFCELPPCIQAELKRVNEGFTFTNC